MRTSRPPLVLLPAIAVVGVVAWVVLWSPAAPVERSHEVGNPKLDGAETAPPRGPVESRPRVTVTRDDVADATRLRGRVIDQHGAPVVAAHVGWVDEGPVVRSDHEGRFEVDRRQRAGILYALADDGRLAGEGDPEAATDGGIVVRPVATIVGRVVDELGAPWTRAMVIGTFSPLVTRGGVQLDFEWLRMAARDLSLDNGLLGGEQLNATIDHEGRFGLPILGVGVARLVAHTAEQAAVQIVSIRSTVRDVEVELRLARRAVLAGVFQGLPPANEDGLVDLWVLSSDEVRQRVAPVAGDGFWIEGLPPQTYSIRASLRGAPLHGRIDDIALARNERRVDLVLRLGPPVTLTGTVHDAGGDPVVGRTVGFGFADDGSLMSMTSTDPDGGFAIHGAAAGLYRLEIAGDPVHLDHGELIDFTHPGERRHVEVILRRGLSISGVVYNVAGEPQAGVDLFLRSAHEGASVSTDETGRYGFQRVRQAPIAIYARHGGPAGQDESTVAQLDPGPHVDAVALDLRLERSSVIRGWLVDRNGVAVGGADVTAVAVDNHRVSRDGVTSLRGEFEIRGLYPGSYRVSAGGESLVATVGRGLPVPTVRIVVEPGG